MHDMMKKDYDVQSEEDDEHNDDEETDENMQDDNDEPDVDLYEEDADEDAEEEADEEVDEEAMEEAGEGVDDEVIEEADEEVDEEVDEDMDLVEDEDADEDVDLVEDGDCDDCGGDEDDNTKQGGYKKRGAGGRRGQGQGRLRMRHVMHKTAPVVSFAVRHHTRLRRIELSMQKESEEGEEERKGDKKTIPRVPNVKDPTMAAAYAATIQRMKDAAPKNLRVHLPTKFGIRHWTKARAKTPSQWQIMRYDNALATADVCKAFLDELIQPIPHALCPWKECLALGTDNDVPVNDANTDSTQI